MLRKIAMVLTTVMLLNGCAVALLAGAGVAVKSAQDRRTVGAQIDDSTIEIKIGSEITDDDALNEHTNVSVTSFNGVVLLTGQAPNDMLRDRIVTIAKATDGVRNVYDQIRITSVASWTTDTTDTWITSKVKTALLSNKQIESLHIKVKTENSEVFLMGLVSKEEADRAVDLARNVTGVDRVVKAFEYK